MSDDLQVQESEAVLEPVLTAFDKRVLAALNEWEDGPRPAPLVFSNAWQVAERVREYDVGAVRDTLRGLTHLGYALSRKFDYRQEWIASWRAREVQ